ncbi:MAG TPA: DUF481 domain-containing protein [Puia sp.]|jgi:hypothetical protein
MKTLLRSLYGLSIFAVLFSGAPAFGQTMDPGSPPSTDSVPPHKSNTDSTHHTDTAHYHFALSAAGTLNNTNSFQSNVWNTALKASLAQKSATFNFNSSWIYGHQGNLLTNNDFSSTADVDLYKTLRHFYYWGLATYNTSVSLLINHQLQTGLGPGYNIIDKKKAVLIVSDGILFEKGDLYDSLYGGANGNVYQRDRYQAFRNSFRLLGHFVIDDRITLDGTWYWQHVLNNWDDYILKLSGGVSLKLYKWLSFSVMGTFNKFTRTRSKNSLVTFGLMIQE